jgi:hypothetical protein
MVIMILTMYLNYQVILKLNAQNLAVQMDLICNVKSNGLALRTELVSK